MAYFEPDGTLKLCADIPISDNQQLVFRNAANQKSYFDTRARFTLDEMSYMSHDGVVSVELSPEQIKTCNYMTWINPTQENIVWYARILSYKWVNSATTTEIMYEVDWFQTFMFMHTIQFAEMDREQMSEEDWNKAIANPYDMSVIELSTPEPIAVGPTFEPNYELSALSAPARAGVSFYPSDAGTNNQRLLLVLNLGWLDDVSSAEWNTAVSASKGTQYTPKMLSSFPTTLGYVSWEINAPGSDWQHVIDYLTINGLTSEIIGFYNVHKDVVDSIAAGGGAWTGEDIELSVFKSYAHPKLARSPFQYLRVTSPSGSNKEYQYERFASLREGGNNFKMSYINNANGNPVSFIAPVNYGVNIDDPIHSIVEDERIEYADMPQVGMNVDAYLTFLSSQYNSAVSSNNAASQKRNEFYGSRDYDITLAKEGGADRNLLGYMKDVVKEGVANTFAPISTEFSAIDIVGAQQAAQANAAAQSAASSSELLSVLREAAKRDVSIADSSALSYARGAYVADIYRPGGSAGYIPYQMGAGTPTWKFTHVSLEENYADRVVEYLNRYGCKSGRFGLPYAYQYMHGGKAPHWTQIDGHNAAYCKCASCDVITNNVIAMRAIQAVYRGGCLFIKGD